MTKIEEKLTKWQCVSVAYQTWLDTLAPKYKIGKTIYTQFGKTLEVIVNDLKELNQTKPSHVENWNTNRYE